MGNVASAVQGGAKTAKLAVSGCAKTHRVVHVVGHIKNNDGRGRRMEIWVETERTATIGWVLSRVMEEMESREPDIPNIVGLRILRGGQDPKVVSLDSVEDDLVVDYGEVVEKLLSNGDSLECLFEVQRTSATSSPRPASEHDPAQSSIGLGHFSIVRVLGMGATSRVIQVCHKGSGRMYAIKAMSKQKLMSDEKTVERVMTEKRILAKLSHPFVVSLHWAFQNGGHLFLVLDYCPGGELFYHFQRLGKFSEADSRFYVSEILLGLEYLHQQNILYRDLKLENCLLDIGGHIRLTDFGLSRDNVQETSLCDSFVGTATYISPEMLRKEGHGLPLDFYCLGCLLYVLLTEKIPHFTNSMRQMYAQRIHGVDCQLPRGCSKEVADLLMCLLETKPTQRLCHADAVKRHPWFTDVDFGLVFHKIPQPVFPSYPPINPELQLDQNFDPRLENVALGASLASSGDSGIAGERKARESGTIAGFSRMD